MNEQIDKRHVDELMTSLGIRAKSRVWSFINGGVHYQSEVDELILRIKAEQDAEDNRPVIAFVDNPVDYPVYGKPLIEQAALDDMAAITRLPYVKSAAQMPDSHRVKEGHVPVGGVIVTYDCVLPGVVGNDIACSVGGFYSSEAVDDQWFADSMPALEYILTNETFFGLEYNRYDVHTHAEYRVIMDEAPNVMSQLHHEESKKLLVGLLGTIRNHFGTSGDGNHFIEIGWSDVQPVRFGTRGHVVLSHNKGVKNFSMLSHFGSRGLGSNVADFYLKKANELNPVPKGMEDNAPLFFGTDMWAEDYWLLMNLCGLFASKGHEWIQRHVLEEIIDRGLLEKKTWLDKFIITTHNFAWAEEAGFVHRKGATPAHSGAYANIPATMGDKSSIVVGLGNPSYLDSASHGAGRKMSRGQALKQGWQDVKEYVLKEHNVVLIGGGSDEDPRSYKKLSDVMLFQTDSVKQIGQFTPMICRMAAPRFSWGKNKKK